MKDSFFVMLIVLFTFFVCLCGKAGMTGIRVDAPEFPIMDGSSVEFVSKIKQTGIKGQDKGRIYYIPNEKIEYIDERSGSHLIFLPADSSGIYVQSMFESEVLNVQSAKLSHISNLQNRLLCVALLSS
jgi:UDP-3-O-[3-hydroxymyristoyl] N-acetylglucosamine deacetylase/3-hydroxyacyl-[acyl-carrier-protein] dehydratase